MLGQRPARRLASMERLNFDLLARRRVRRHLRRRFGFGGVLLHIGEPQLQLLECESASNLDPTLHRL
jgi:hypothetical protein